MLAPLDPLVEALIRGVERGEPEPSALERLGDPEPARSAQALATAASRSELAPWREAWLPALLHSARPGAGAEALVALADASLQLRGRPLEPQVLAPLARVVGSSPFLARLLRRHPDWCDDLAGEPPPDTAAPAADWSAIRTAKYRGLLRVAARDLAGRRMDGSLRELSDLADGCLSAALECAVRERGGELPALFALGKLGGRELNFSSDVDVLFLYALQPNQDELARARQVQDVVRSFKSGLEERTEEGFGYRVDLDLRPEGRVGTLANPVEAALSYYEVFGADWERQMLIRLRPVCGPEAAQQSFLREITPFVYRGLIDPGAIAGVRQIKLRIEAERRAGGVDLEADLKEGPGGIRDVEFLVQALQLIRGGREPALRTGNVLDALAALGQSGALTDGIVESLIDAYRWLRRAEHAVQMVEERQTHRFPRDARGQLELARRMGYHDGEARVARDRLLEDWTNIRAEVRGHFESLLLGPTDTESAG